MSGQGDISISAFGNSRGSGGQAPEASVSGSGIQGPVSRVPEVLRMSPGGSQTARVLRGGLWEPFRDDSGLILKGSRPRNPCSHVGESSIFKKLVFLR